MCKLKFFVKPCSTRMLSNVVQVEVEVEFQASRDRAEVSGIPHSTFSWDECHRLHRE